MSNSKAEMKSAHVSYGIARLMENGNYVSMPGRFKTFPEAKDVAGEWKRQRPAVNYVVTENGNVCFDVEAA